MCDYVKHVVTANPQHALKIYQRVVMLRLNLLGGVNLLDSDGAPFESRLGPRPMALLVFLVIEGRARAVRRDRAAALLWPESDQQKARASLTQALYDLRRALGEEVVWSRGKEEIGVDVAHLTCDCFELIELAAAGSLEECVALYRGVFAAGLFARDAHTFEEWLDQQREYWRAAFAKVLLELQRSAMAHDDLRQAAIWAERFVDVAPGDDTAVRAVLPLLIERDQIAAAAKLYEVFEYKLRDYLDIDPPADLAELIARVRARDAKPAGAPIYIGAPKWLPRRRAALSATAAVGIAFVGGMLAFASRPVATDRLDTSYLTHVAAPTIVIVPLQHAGDPVASRTATVLTEALQWRLRDRGFVVLSGESVSDIGTLARALRTTNPASLGFVVTGELTSSANGITTTLQITDANTRNVLWTEEFNESRPDLYNVGTELSDAVGAEIRRAVGRLVEITPARVKPATEHWRDVYRAREHIEGAREMRLVGALSGAHTELQLADSILANVAEFEPKWPLPSVLRSRIAEARANVALIAHKGDTRQPGIEIERGIDVLDSAIAALPVADLFERRGLLKYRRWLYGVNDVAEARALLASADADLRKALDLGGHRSSSYVTLSGVALGQGKFGEAYVYAGRAYETNVFLRQNEEILARLFNSAFHAGDDRAAEHWCEEIRRALPQQWPAIFCRIELAASDDRADINDIQSAITRMAGPPPQQRVMRPRLMAAYANMLARRGMADSARIVLRHTLGQEVQDPELFALNAFALRALGQTAEANLLVGQYLASNGGTRSAILFSRWLN